jgi:hypothetical protein
LDYTAGNEELDPPAKIIEENISIQYLEMLAEPGCAFFF